MKIKNYTIRRMLSFSMLMVAVCLCVAFAAGCGKISTSDSPCATPTGSDEQVVTPTEGPAPVGTEGKTIVVVFSQTGNTKRVAERRPRKRLQAGL